MKPLLVEVITYAPADFYHCTHCELVWHQVGLGQKWHADQRRAAFPSDLQQDYAALCDWVRGLYAKYGDRLIVKVIDAASLEGFFKSLRYGVRKYPAFIIGGQAKHVGCDFPRVEAIVGQHLAVL